MAKTKRLKIQGAKTKVHLAGLKQFVGDKIALLVHSLSERSPQRPS
jgi:hypothetical protein